MDNPQRKIEIDLEQKKRFSKNNMGVIYMVTFPDGKKYIGQTKQKLEKRIFQHKCCKNNTCISVAFRQYKNNYKVETLIEIENDLLDEYEQKYIKEFNTISPNGHNISKGGNGKASLTLEEKEHFSKIMRKHQPDLPMYIFKETRRGRGYRVRPPDGRPDRYFTADYLTDEQNLALAKEYLEGKSTELQEKLMLPKYLVRVVRPDRCGYRAIPPGYPSKYFSSMKQTDEQKLKAAIAYLNQTIYAQRLNVSGEALESLLKIQSSPESSSEENTSKDGVCINSDTTH